MTDEQVDCMSLSEKLAARQVVLSYLRDKTERASAKVLRSKDGDWEKNHKALMKASAEYKDAQHGRGWVKFYDKVAKRNA